VQGWVVTDLDILGRLTLSDDETVVEVPAKLMRHLIKDGLPGEVTSYVPPIAYVKGNGNYIIQGKRVTDSGALAEMDIPNHETCVEVSKAQMRVLVEARS
jgi:hypothetical protein